MVLGLIDFLLGGKKKTQLPKTARVATPQSSPDPSPQSNPGPSVPSNNLPDGVNKPTENIGQDNSNPQSGLNNEIKREDGKGQDVTGGVASVKASNPSDNGQSGLNTSSNPLGGSSGPVGKSSVSEAIGKLHSELKSSGERVTGLVTDFKNLENTVSDLGHKIETLEEHRKVTDEKLSEMDENMTKFLSLYELINNQYNPFVDKDAIVPTMKKPIAVDADGNSLGNKDSDGSDNSVDFNALKSETKKEIDLKKGTDLDSVLLELDTLNIEEAAADAVPLTTLRNNTNSLVIILSWLEYLIKRVGLDETRNSLRYYTEVLRWITPEVYFELDKYLRGMKDVKVEEGTTLSVRDHIVSLYFISKLNEKQLDDKLTNAVLQIIKN